MTSRLLPVAEWSALDGTTAAAIWRSFCPDHVEVIVVEDEGVIVGQLVLMDVVHAECAEVAPAHRGRVAVQQALMDALRARMVQHGVQAVWASAVDEPMRRLLAHRADPVPGVHFLFSAGKES